MEARLRKGKGKSSDMATRLRADNNFDVPDAVFGDRLAVLVAQIQMWMADLPAERRRIEKFAAYFILGKQEYIVPRALRNLLEHAVGRLKKRGGPQEGLFYNDLFRAGAWEPNQFLLDHPIEAEMLRDLFIEIE